MPTAAKLVSAIYMALAGVLVIMVVVNVYPSLEREANGMAITAAIVGMLVGWRGLGSQARFQDRSAAGLGLRSGVTAVLWMLFLFAVNHMIQGMLHHAYYQPMSALLQIPARMMEYGRVALDWRIAATIVILAAIGGVIAKRTGEKWS